MREAANRDQVPQLSPAVMIGQTFDHVLERGPMQRVVRLMFHARSLHRDRLGQIAWLVNVRALGARRVIGQQLQWHHVQDG